MIDFVLLCPMGIGAGNGSLLSTLRATVDAVQLADDLGFVAAWFEESSASDQSFLASGLMVATHCAGKTSRIRLGPALSVSADTDPGVLVDEFELADLLGRGRLSARLSARQSEPACRAADENALLAILDDFAERRMCTNSRHAGGRAPNYSAKSAGRPFGLRPRDMAVDAGSSEALLARASRDGHPIVLACEKLKLEEAVARRRVLAERWLAIGGDRGNMPLVIQRYVYVTDDRSEARRVARAVAGDAPGSGDAGTRGSHLRLVGADAEPAGFAEAVVVGSAEDCAERLVAEITALHATSLACVMPFHAVGRREALASLERLGDEVLPQVGATIGEQRAGGSPAGESANGGRSSPAGTAR